MQPLTRYTTTVRLVLGALLDGHDYGYAIGQVTGLESGTVTPILRRLHERGWVTAEVERPVPADRPPRRYYRLVEDARLPAEAHAIRREHITENGDGE